MTQDRGYEVARAAVKAFEQKCSLVAVLVMAVACLVLVL